MSGVRCINDHVKKNIFVSALFTLLGTLMLTGCGKKPQMAFEDLPEGSLYGVTQEAGGKVEPFSGDLCIADGKDESLM